MEIYNPHIEILSKKMKAAVNVNDLTDVLNMIISIQNENGANYKFLDNKRVTKYYYSLEKKYHQFTIPKKSGEERIINAPDRFLIKIQRRISVLLYMFFTPSEYAHGFLLKRSIKTNALPHVKKQFVFNMDLENFFPSVSFFRVRAVLQLEPFELKKEFAHIVANFCCLKGYLPQGAPTSPIITNIICQRLDRKLGSLSNAYDLAYTRYADDLTFSSNYMAFKEKIVVKIVQIINAEGFEINKTKTRLNGKNNCQDVTGIVTNEKINVNRKYIRSLRAMIHNFKTNKPMPGNIENVISGKLLFLKMVRGEDELYKKLNQKFLKDV